MSLLDILIAAVAIILMAGLLWPLLPQRKPEGDGKLPRLAERIWHFQCEQAGKHLSEHEAKMLGRELVHDLPLTSSSPFVQRPMPIIAVVAAVIVIFLSSAVLYVLSPRGALVQAERQRLADPLHDFSDAQQQEKQLAALQDNIRKTPGNSVLWAELGEYYLYRNAYDNALRAYRQAIALKGDSAELYSALATVLYYQSGQAVTPPMQEMVDKALALDANEVTALMLLASDAFLKADYARAITIWQRLLDTYSPRVNRAQLIEAINTATLLKNSQR
ncbi:heme lyase NrfEFG subunit NrfG [Pectobacterium wasabiae]|uniref:Nitrite reductase n=1 Tax=Pectobacterium wasabiae TaxID=55208 RepID=A0AAW3EFG0_9GAMM|nr:heme lyase NrfEFG subunit NrfG [Pectobacterium wasabiae]AOR65770.1 heme lyase NrfEFG subunit NrfG [Pectobacterium wasabiae CFBP 3304]EJS94706.1 Formate-dependent nitrite reductase complex subunit NrfG [Pectobacterium wasabiae CFBP 3304]KFX05497.1 nitrite reductase [Pectobacterium wasabiae]KGA30350.1 nitrite reductase [Pectobacterium wasabiae]